MNEAVKKKQEGIAMYLLKRLRGWQIIAAILIGCATFICGKWIDKIGMKETEISAGIQLILERMDLNHERDLKEGHWTAGTAWK